jgi:hypothetical protein
LDIDSKSSSVYLSELSLKSFLAVSAFAGAGGAEEIPPFFAAYFLMYSSMASVEKISASPAGFEVDILSEASIAALPGQ